MEGKRTGARRRASPHHQLSRRPIFAFGVLLALSLAFEFWVLYHNGPTHPHGPTPQHPDPFSSWPGLVPLEGANKHSPLGVPGAPSVPDSSRDYVPGTERVAIPSQRVEPGEAGENSAVVSFELPPRQYLSGQQGESSSSEDEGYGDMRVAVLVPYSGAGLPVWFDAFTDLAAASKDLVDWIVFCEEKLAQVKTPPNVRMISTSSAELAWMLAGVVYPAHADEYPDVYVSDFKIATKGPVTDRQERARNARGMAAKFIQKLLAKNPYYMVEFKPALAWVFRDYLKEYSHWAYGDLDVFFGDLTKGWLEPSEMQNYDIVTYSFGDQHRAYLRGQLTVHKNIQKVNNIWRKCPHLSSYLKRIERTIQTKQYNLESAEGCYSMALMYSEDIKAKYAVKVFTDMRDGYGSDQDEVVITGDALIKRCPQQVGRRGDVVEPDYGRKMQVDHGDFFPVEMEEPGYFCEYWVSPSFQTCLRLNQSDSTNNIFLLEGQYYERGFVNLWRDKVEDGCSMGAFHHFQEFKESYRAWNTRPPMPPVHKGMVAGKGGLVPLPNGDWYAMALDPDAPPPANRDRFTYRYCLQWSVQERPREAKFSCDVSLTPRDGLRTLHDSRPEDARRGYLSGGAAVTLGGVGGVSDVPGLLRSCRDWEGPKVLVLLLQDPRHEGRIVQDLISEEEKYWGLDNAYIVYFSVPNSDGEDVNGGHLPTKALLNAVGDLCQTRHLLTLPAGFRMATGSEDAVVAALETPTEVPRVLIIPQWCVDHIDGHAAEEFLSLDLEDLRKQSANGTADLCVAREDSPFPVYLLGPTIKAAVGDGGIGQGLTGNHMRHGGEQNWRRDSGVALLRADAVSPVIVVDMWSAPGLFLRHVEELSRSQCFDGAYSRGLWAAGFSFEVLPEAAAITDSLPPAFDECRDGVDSQMKAYSFFLQDVRRMYSGEHSNHLDFFRVGIRADAKAQGRSRKSAHPFRRIDAANEEELHL